MMASHEPGLFEAFNLPTSPIGEVSLHLHFLLLFIT